MSRRKLIYLGGWGRSGSSVIANVLGSHERAVSVGEVRYLWDRGVLEDKRCGCGEEFSHCEFWRAVVDRTPQDLDRRTARHQMQDVGSKATWRQLRAMLLGGVERYRRKNRASIVGLEHLYAAAADVAGVDVLIDASKTPPYALNLLGSENFEVHFVHLVRDPRAVAFSWARKRETKESRNELLPRYSAFKSSIYWMIFNALGLWFRGRRDCTYLLVRYESFCENPKAVIEQILAHCDLPTAGGLCWFEANSVRIDPQHSISGNPSRFDVGRVEIRPDDEWRSRMRPFSRGLVTMLCAPLLGAFGYTIRTPDSHG